MLGKQYRPLTDTITGDILGDLIPTNDGKLWASTTGEQLQIQFLMSSQVDGLLETKQTNAFNGMVSTSAEAEQWILDIADNAAILPLSLGDALKSHAPNTDTGTTADIFQVGKQDFKIHKIQSSNTDPLTVIFGTESIEPNQAWKAFDGNEYSNFAANSFAGVDWVGIDHGEGVLYKAVRAVVHLRYAEDFTIEGSTDLISWDVLKTETGWSNFATPEEIIFDTSDYYRAYRINVTKTPTPDQVRVRKLSFYETMTDLVAINPTPAFTPISDSGTPANAFDGNTSTQWKGTTNQTGYIGIDLGAGNELVLNGLRFTHMWDNDYIKLFNIEGSNTGYDVLSSEEYIDNLNESGDIESNVYLFNNTTAYRYYRINILSAGNFPHLLELEFFDNATARAIFNARTMTANATIDTMNTGLFSKDVLPTVTATGIHENNMLVFVGGEPAFYDATLDKFKSQIDGRLLN